MEGICFPVTGATFALIPQVAAGSPLGKYNHHLRLNVPFALIFRGGDLLGGPYSLLSWEVLDLKNKQLLP